MHLIIFICTPILDLLELAHVHMFLDYSRTLLYISVATLLCRDEGQKYGYPYFGKV